MLRTLECDLPSTDSVLERERAYHEKLYSGFAQKHFARPAVRAFREHLAKRILHLTEAGRSSRVLSLGCGIGDTELLLAPHIAEVVGLDLSPSAVRQARADAELLSFRNVTFVEGTEPDAGDRFDVIIAIFLLHHLPDEILFALPVRLGAMLNPGGVFYSLDPSIRRLSGAIGRRLIPNMMKKYQSPDERELDPRATAELFRGAGFQVRSEMYDFGSTPFAGLFPAWRLGYRAVRAADDFLLRVSALKRVGSNFEIIATRP